MEAGELTEEGLSLGRTALRWTARLAMLPAGLPSRWWQLDWPDVCSFRYDEFMHILAAGAMLF